VVQEIYRVVIPSEAKRHVKFISDFIARDNPERAASFGRELIEKAKSLALAPYSGSSYTRYERAKRNGAGSAKRSTRIHKQIKFTQTRDMGYTFENRCVLEAVVEKPLIGGAYASLEIGLWFPAQGFQTGNVQQFTGGAVRLAVVPPDLPLVADNPPHRLGEFFNRDVLPGADINDFRLIVDVDQKVARVGQVINVEKLPSRRTGAPERHAIGLPGLSQVKFMNEGW